MRTKFIVLAIFGILIFLSMVTYQNVAAQVVVSTTRYVAPTLNACTTLGTTPCYTTIQSAIQAAITACENQTGNTDTIIITPGTYASASFPAITRDCTLTVRGKEAARTILSGGTSDTLIAATNTNTAVTLSVTIHNLKFQNAGTGIRASGSVTITIRNNIFQNITGTAIILSQPQSATIDNNTFYQNGTAITRDSTGPIIRNNIFNGNTTSVVSPNSTSNLNKNCYFTNGDDNSAVRESTAIKEDPDFVKVADGDFHLLETSPCINAGDTAVLNNTGDTSKTDIGAYGGQSDTIPFIVSGVSVTVQDSSATVNWSPNNSYVVTNNTNTSLRGGYNVRYKLGRDGVVSKVTVTSPTTSAIISGLTATIAIDPPALNEPEFASQTLIVKWSAVTNATKYFVHYTDTDIVGAPTFTVDTGTQTSVVLGSLVNGHTYRITTSAVAQPTYFFYVTAFDNIVLPAQGGTPGESHESTLSNEVSRQVGTASESVLSDPVYGMPEEIIPYPNLPNSGCFIATAAYGYYSAPQVQALREFRDRFLMTNQPGRAFIEWYYRYGPIGAEFMNNHAWVKPVVRVALLPAVNCALFMTRTSLPTKIIVILFIGFLFIYLIQTRKVSRSGGAR